MNRDAEDRLMRYLDGDCEPAEAAEVERWLARSPEARALLADFETAGELVREVSHQGAARADGIADSVMAHIGSGGTHDHHAGGGRLLRPGRWLARAPAAGLALAAAASVALFLRSHGGPVLRASEPPASSSRAPLVLPVATVPTAEPQAGPAEPQGAPSEPQAAAADEGEVGASIEAVDFGGGNGTIFVVSSGPEETPVVWLMDEPPTSKGRMKPL